MSPAKLVAYACQKGLRAFALTDHDTVAGLPEAFAAAEGTALEVIAGIEFSTEYHGKDIHIVGLDIDYQSAEFCERLTRFQDSRDVRNEKMINYVPNLCATPAVIFFFSPLPHRLPYLQ